MGMIIIRHKVRDYGQVVAFDTKDTKVAKEFASSPDLKEAMIKAGVEDMPTIYFLESID